MVQKNRTLAINYYSYINNLLASERSLLVDRLDYAKIAVQVMAAF